MVRQPQAFRDEVDCLDSFQSGFRPAYGIETAFAALGDDVHQEMGRGSATLLFLLDLLVAFDVIDHSVLLEHPCWLELLFCSGSGRTWRMDFRRWY